VSEPTPSGSTLPSPAPLAPTPTPERPPSAAVAPTAAPAATPSPAPTSGPTPTKPLAKPPSPAAAPRIPRTGALQDRGVTRRDSVHALTWTADGTVKVTGEIDVGRGTVSGALSAAGPITADTFACRGALDAGAALTVAGSLTTGSSFHAVGPVHAQQAAFTGMTRIVREVRVDGTLTVKGQFAAPSVRAGEFRADGAVDVPGTLDASSVEVRIRGESRFGTIRARSVRLIRAPPNPIERIFGRPPPTPIVRIEADRVELEGVDVAFVHSPEVILGRGAHVTEIEGTVAHRHASAQVGPRSKSPAPYGLSR
jgi:cytoskeletal protein CcmA (bactofilin family)